MLFGRPRPVHFVYAEQFATIGSTVMRGRQLADLMTRLGDPRREYRFSPTTASFSKSVLFLTKNALKVLGPDDLERYRERRNILLFDVVDEPPPPTTDAFAHAIVAASRTAAASFRDRYRTPVVLVNHHVDPRLSDLDLPVRTAEFRAGYFGELFNTVITDRISDQVDFVRVSTAEQDDTWLRRVSGYTAHYAVRKSIAQDAYKPFLKGFTAAACGANVLIQETELEALSWLGDDYPFLLRGGVDEAAILESIETARDAFGGPDWADGLARMAEIRQATSDAAIAAEIESAIATVA